jgi:hypothetical protein
MPAKKTPVVEEKKEEGEAVPEVKEENGYGRFEYINGSVYIGNWKSMNGICSKHGYGKLTLSGTTSNEIGN